MKDVKTLSGIIYLIIFQLILMLATIGFGFFEKINLFAYIFISITFFHLFKIFKALIRNRGRYVKSYSLSLTLVLFLQFILLVIFNPKDIVESLIIEILILSILNKQALTILGQRIFERIKIELLVFFALALVFVLIVSKEISLAIIILKTCLVCLAIIPMLILIKNYKKIEKYTRHLKLGLLVLAISDFSFYWFNFLPKLESLNIGYYIFIIHINIIILVLNYFIDKQFFYKKKKIYGLPIDLIFIIAVILVLKNDLILSFEIITIYIFTRILAKEINIIIGIKNIYEDYDVFEKELLISVKEYKKEELYREQMSIYLHNEVLQDILLIKKLIVDDISLKYNKKIIDSIDKLVHNIRDKINLYKPYINDRFTLSENYNSLFNGLRKTYSNIGKLIEFECDRDIFLSGPYDLLVYRILHELATNIYKHSKGNYSKIKVFVKEGFIYINQVNYDDDFNTENNSFSQSRGLKIIEREVKRFNGEFEIKQEYLKLSEYKQLIITISIPIESELTYESFINR